MDLRGYQSFLFLIGSVFVPLVAVMITDWFVVSRGEWDLSESSPLRPAMLVAWLTGFVAYQLVNPGYVNGWNDFWVWVQSADLVHPADLAGGLVVRTGGRCLGHPGLRRTSSRTWEPVHV